MEHKKTFEYINKEFDDHIIPTLMDYVRIDNLSPCFDPEWATNGKAEKAANLLLEWVLKQGVQGLKGEVMKIEGISPIVFIEIESNGGNGTVFMYGHFDKQPHFDGWLEGTGPTNPKIIGDLLYGRGASDDGYAIFSSVLAIKSIQAFGHKHGKISILIEGSEESGSPHLMQYIEKLEKNIGSPDLLVCLDSGVKDYERLWVTTSLRGAVMKDIEVKCLQEAVHSGLGTGQGPDSFTVIRQLLDRLEDPKTSEVVSDFQVQIPESKFVEAKDVSEILGDKFALAKTLDGVKFIKEDLTELYLGGTWKATLCVTGQSGLPPHETAGNVLRASTTVRISMRIPPTLSPQVASERIDQILLKDPPYNSKVSVTTKGSGPGWASNEFSDKLRKSLSNSSQTLFGKDIQTFGEGGSIPFIHSLAVKFPKSDFLVLGVLGPGSNAHAANETLHIPFCKKLTVTLTHAVYDLFN
jgi:acetylornithine deacetylase/succinyl-diaminopimelate desuccinylase-like protein